MMVKGPNLPKNIVRHNATKLPIERVVVIPIERPTVPNAETTSNMILRIATPGSNKEMTPHIIATYIIAIENKVKALKTLESAMLRLKAFGFFP